VATDEPPGTADPGERRSGAGRGTSAIGVVTIGRNEGRRLAECLTSILAHPELPIVYVDSSSTDGSADLGRAMGIEVVALEPGPRFTAAMARNAGFERLAAVAPELDYVMFLDGDCTLAPGWLDRAVAELDDDPGLAVVTGRRRERDARLSIFRRLMDIEWCTPVGEVEACGGDAAMRVRPFRHLGGFEPTLPAGEEPEFCHRLRCRGWRILRADVEMSCHDMGEASAGPWWRRNVRHGYAAGDVARRFPGPAGPYRRQVISAWTWGALAPLCVLVAAVLGPRLSGWSPASCGLIASLIYPVQALRIAREARSRSPDLATAMAHGVAMLVAKWPHLLGQLAFLRDRLKGRSPRYIEYRRSRRSVESRGH
jgi:GT2 family glycosyltransferase